MFEMASAAAMTTARLESQAPKISRNPKTLAGCTIPEISNPRPKMKPQTKLAIANMGQFPNT
jgi:hypothetical protein